MQTWGPAEDFNQAIMIRAKLLFGQKNNIKGFGDEVLVSHQDTASE